MKREDLEGSFHKRHTVEVKIDGNEQRVSILYLEALKGKFGKRLEISKKEDERAKAYIADDAKVKAEQEKVMKAIQANAAKARAKKADKKDPLS